MSISRRLALAGAAFAALATAQDNAQGQKVTVQFRDPAASKKLEVNLMTVSANVTVRGVQRNDVEVDYSGSFRGARGAEPPPGMHRIGGSGSLDVTQDNNTVRVSGARFFSGMGDINIQVPLQTAVSVSQTLNGRIVVENVAGEIDVSNLNGDINITNSSGPVVAHSTNGRIIASLGKIAPGKAISFSTFNGEIDVTMPADSKATLKARADNGDIFTDFDVKLTLTPNTSSGPGAGGGLGGGQGIGAPASPAPPAPPAPPSTGQTVDEIRERAREASEAARAAAEIAREAGRQASRAAREFGRSFGGAGYVEGTVNGGGTEMQFTTFNGRILIHKK